MIVEGDRRSTDVGGEEREEREVDLQQEVVIRVVEEVVGRDEQTSRVKQVQRENGVLLIG